MKILNWEYLKESERLIEVDTKCFLLLKLILM